MQLTQSLKRALLGDQSVSHQLEDDRAAALFVLSLDYVAVNGVLRINSHDFVVVEHLLPDRIEALLIVHRVGLRCHGRRNLLRKNGTRGRHSSGSRVQL